MFYNKILVIHGNAFSRPTKCGIKDRSRSTALKRALLGNFSISTNDLGLINVSNGLRIFC